MNGYHAAYKVLNKQRNFKRAFDNIIVVKEEIHLAEIYALYSKKYFKEAKDLYLGNKGDIADEN